MSLKIKPLNGAFGVTGQIGPADLADLAAASYSALICTRPDGEVAGQPSFAEVAGAAEALGLQAMHIPVSGSIGADQIAAFNNAWAELPKPILGYCGSGARAAGLFAAARA